MFIQFIYRTALKLGSSVLLILFSFQGNSQSHWQSSGLDVDQQILDLFHDTIDNKLYACGVFNNANGMYVKGIVNWDGTVFSSMGLGFDFYWGTPFVRKIIRYKNQIYVGGDFRSADTINVYGIARWTGLKWDSLNSGLKGENQEPSSRISALVIHNNELIVGGAFEYAGNNSAHSVARWDSTGWHDAFNFPRNTSNTTHVLCLASYQGGLYVGGWIAGNLNANVNIMYYNGQNWSVVGGGILGNDAGAYCMEVYKNELYVGGCFNKQDGNLGNGIQKWNGQQWSEVGGGVTLSNSYFSAVKQMHIFNNELYISGDFDKAGNIPAYYFAKWDGVQWCSLDNNLPSSFSAMGDYDNKLVCAGYLTINNDTIPQWLVNWTGGNYVDSCGIYNSISENINQIPAIKIYPNPVTRTLFINGEQILEIQVSNIIGQRLIEFINSQKQNDLELNISNLKSGLYLITVITSKGNYNQKVFKE